MWEFILFLRDFFVDFSNVLDSFSFDIVGMNITLFEMFVGIVAMGIIVAVFWKGART